MTIWTVIFSFVGILTGVLSGWILRIQWESQQPYIVADKRYLKKRCNRAAIAIAEMVTAEVGESAALLVLTESIRRALEKYFIGSSWGGA